LLSELTLEDRVLVNFANFIGVKPSFLLSAIEKSRYRQSATLIKSPESEPIPIWNENCENCENAYIELGLHFADQKLQEMASFA